MSLSRGVSGLSEIAEKFERVTSRTLDGAREALFVAGQHVLGVSSAQAPIETGAMIRTGAVSQDSSSALTAVHYDDAEYEGQAVQQHEDMSLRHDDGRNAKFLENSMNSERDMVLQIIGVGASKGTTE
jgi:hypothetical protein